VKKSYQQGSLEQVKRKQGWVWRFRWRENGVPKARILGWLRELPTEADARNKLHTLSLDINRRARLNQPRTFAELIRHYSQTELARDNFEHKTYSTKETYEIHLRNHIVPVWGEYRLDEMENGIAVEVESWLKKLRRKDGKPMARGTKSKIRNLMSGLCTHAMRYGWLKLNPIAPVRQSAKRERIPANLEVEELQGLYEQLNLMERVLILLDVPTGMRVGELLAVKWRDFDWEKKTLNIYKSIWHQHVGPVKTAASEKVMPLDDEMITDLQLWRMETPYADQDDWVFASFRKKGRQPLWPEALMRNHIRPAAVRAGISKHISWHVFRHSFSNLLIANGEDVKTVQSLMRHANSRITLDIYSQGVDRKKREAQSRVADIFRKKVTAIS
jgi:integrase